MSTIKGSNSTKNIVYLRKNPPQNREQNSQNQNGGKCQDFQQNVKINSMTDQQTSMQFIKNENDNQLLAQNHESNMLNQRVPKTQGDNNRRSSDRTDRSNKFNNSKQQQNSQTSQSQNNISIKVRQKLSQTSTPFNQQEQKQISFSCGQIKSRGDFSESERLEKQQEKIEEHNLDNSFGSTQKEINAQPFIGIILLNMNEKQEDTLKNVYFIVINQKEVKIQDHYEFTVSSEEDELQDMQDHFQVITRKIDFYFNNSEEGFVMAYSSKKVKTLLKQFKLIFLEHEINKEAIFLDTIIPEKYIGKNNCIQLILLIEDLKIVEDATLKEKTKILSYFNSQYSTNLIQFILKIISQGMFITSILSIGWRQRNKFQNKILNYIKSLQPKPIDNIDNPEISNIKEEEIQIQEQQQDSENLTTNSENQEAQFSRNVQNEESNILQSNNENIQRMIMVEQIQILEKEQSNTVVADQFLKKSIDNQEKIQSRKQSENSSSLNNKSISNQNQQNQIQQEQNILINSEPLITEQQNQTSFSIVNPNQYIYQYTTNSYPQPIAQQQQQQQKKEESIQDINFNQQSKSEQNSIKKQNTLTEEVQNNPLSNQNSTENDQQINDIQQIQFSRDPNFDYENIKLNYKSDGEASNSCRQNNTPSKERVDENEDFDIIKEIKKEIKVTDQLSESNTLLKQNIAQLFNSQEQQLNYFTTQQNNIIESLRQKQKVLFEFIVNLNNQTESIIQDQQQQIKQFQEQSLKNNNIQKELLLNQISKQEKNVQNQQNTLEQFISRVQFQEESKQLELQQQQQAMQEASRLLLDCSQALLTKNPISISQIRENMLQQSQINQSASLNNIQSSSYVFGNYQQSNQGNSMQQRFVNQNQAIHSDNDQNDRERFYNSSNIKNKSQRDSLSSSFQSQKNPNQINESSFKRSPKQNNTNDQPTLKQVIFNQQKQSNQQPENNLSIEINKKTEDSNKQQKKAEQVRGIIVTDGKMSLQQQDIQSDQSNNLGCEDNTNLNSQSNDQSSNNVQILSENFTTKLSQKSDSRKQSTKNQDDEHKIQELKAFIQNMNTPESIEQQDNILVKEISKSHHSSVSNISSISPHEINNEPQTQDNKLDQIEEKENQVIQEQTEQNIRINNIKYVQSQQNQDQLAIKQNQKVSSPTQSRNVYQSHQIQVSPPPSKDQQKNSENENSKDMLEKFDSYNNVNNLKSENIGDSYINQPSSSQLNFQTDNDLLKPSSTELNSSILKSSENIQDENNEKAKRKKKLMLKKKMNQSIEPFQLNNKVLEQITYTNSQDQTIQPQSFTQNSLKIFGFQQEENYQQNNQQQNQPQNSLEEQLKSYQNYNNINLNHYEAKNLSNQNYLPHQQYQLNMMNQLNFFSNQNQNILNQQNGDRQIPSSLFSQNGQDPINSTSRNNPNSFFERKIQQTVPLKIQSEYLNDLNEQSIQNKNLSEFIEEQQKRRKDSVRDLQESVQSSHNTSQVITKSESSILQSELFEQPKKSIFEGNSFMQAIYQQAQETQQRIQSNQSQSFGQTDQSKIFSKQVMKSLKKVKKGIDRLENDQKKIKKQPSSSQSDQDEYKNNNSTNKNSDNYQYNSQSQKKFNKNSNATILKDQDILDESDTTNGQFNSQRIQKLQDNQKEVQQKDDQEIQDQTNIDRNDAFDFEDNDFQDYESNQNGNDNEDIEFNSISNSDKQQSVNNLQDDQQDCLIHEEGSALIKQQRDSHINYPQNQVLQQFLKPSSSSQKISLPQQNGSTSSSYCNQKAGQTIDIPSGLYQSSSITSKTITDGVTNTINRNSNLNNNNCNRNTKTTERSYSANKNIHSSSQNQSAGENSNQNYYHNKYNLINQDENQYNHKQVRSQSSQPIFIESTKEQFQKSMISQRKMSETQIAVSSHLKTIYEQKGFSGLNNYETSETRIDEEEKLNSSIISRQTEVEYNNIYELIKPRNRLSPKEISQALKRNCEEVQQRLNQWQQQENDIYNMNPSSLGVKNSIESAPTNNEIKKKKLNKSTIQMIIILKFTTNQSQTEIIEINSIIVNTNHYQMIDEFKQSIKPNDMRVNGEKDYIQQQTLKRIKAAQPFEVVFAKLCNFFKPYLDNYKCCIFYESDSDPEILYNEFVNKKIIPCPKVFEIFYTCIMLADIYPHSFHNRNRPINNHFQAMLSLGIKQYQNKKGKTSQIKNIEKVVTTLLTKGVIISSKDVKCAFHLDQLEKKVQKFMNLCINNFEETQFFFILQFQHGKNDDYNQIENSALSIQILQKTNGFYFMVYDGFYAFHYDFYRSEKSAFHFYFQSYLNAMKINPNKISLLVNEEDHILSNQAIELMFPLKKKPYLIVLLKEVETYIQLNFDQVIQKYHLSFDFEKVFSILCGQKQAANNLLQI